MSTTDNIDDMELGVSETPKQLPRVPEERSGDALVMQTSFQNLQAELNNFLDTHTEKTLALQASLSSMEQRGARAKLNVRMSVQETDPPSPMSGMSEKPRPASQSQSARSSVADTSRAVDAHADHLRGFLSSHMNNIRSLHDTLPMYPVAVNAKSPLQRLPAKGVRSSGPDDEKAYKSLSEQFNMLVLISTFTASLIVAFVSLARSIVSDSHPVAFNVGMLLAFFAMSIHFGNIIVAGRGAAIASQHWAADHWENAQKLPGLAFFRPYLELCEQLQFFATVSFIVAIIELTFIMFNKLEYPLVLLGVVVVASAIVFWAIYWKVSITSRNLKFLVHRAGRLRSRLCDRSVS